MRSLTCRRGRSARKNMRRPCYRDVNPRTPQNAFITLMRRVLEDARARDRERPRCKPAFVRSSHSGERQRQYPGLSDDRRHRWRCGTLPGGGRTRGRCTARRCAVARQTNQPNCRMADQNNSGVWRHNPTTSCAFRRRSGAPRRQSPRISPARGRGHRRLDPRSRGLLRHCRFSSDHGALLHSRVCADIAALRPGRTACAQHRGSGLV